ncbi:MAG: four helix bundle protein [Flavobacteriales bacterium]|nr:MAG: four helix bundle protein [Flavobacteriales bacterium]
MDRKNDLCERLLRFAVDVILYLRTVKNSVETMDMKRQLIKASTSSGANYEESQGSPTKPDAKTKIGISLKEMRESNYFLKIFKSLKLGDVQKNECLVNESSELKRNLASILNKLTVLFSFSWGLGLEI